MVEQTEIPFVAIPSGKVRRYWSWHNFIDPFFVLGGGLMSLALLLIFRPQVIVSAGSFVSVPVAYAAWILRIPHVILQMDVLPGRYSHTWFEANKEKAMEDEDDSDSDVAWHEAEQKVEE